MRVITLGLTFRRCIVLDTEDANQSVFVILIQVTHTDFKKAKEKVMYKKKEGVPEGLYM